MKNGPDFDFLDEPADLVPDEDPEILPGGLLVCVSLGPPGPGVRRRYWQGRVPGVGERNRYPPATAEVRAPEELGAASEEYCSDGAARPG